MEHNNYYPRFVECIPNVPMPMPVGVPVQMPVAAQENTHNNDGAVQIANGQRIVAGCSYAAFIPFHPPPQQLPPPPAVQMHRFGAIIKLSNVHYSLTECDLWRIFNISGQLRNVELLRNSNGRSQGKAILVYENYEAGRCALQRFSSKVIFGRRLIVKLLN